VCKCRFANAARGAGQLWIKSAVLSFGRSLPVCPYQQTFSRSVGMSQRCQQLLSQNNGVVLNFALENDHPSFIELMDLSVGEPRSEV
jgi:hypothetical protein